MQLGYYCSRDIPTRKSLDLAEYNCCTYGWMNGCADALFKSIDWWLQVKLVQWNRDCLGSVIWVHLYSSSQSFHTHMGPFRFDFAIWTQVCTVILSVSLKLYSLVIVHYLILTLESDAPSTHYSWTLPFHPRLCLSVKLFFYWLLWIHISVCYSWILRPLRWNCLAVVDNSLPQNSTSKPSHLSSLVPCGLQPKKVIWWSIQDIWNG